MSMETFTLVARETETHDGIDVDVVDEDGLVEATTQVTYSDYELMAERDEESPDPVEADFTADAQRITVDLRRNNRNFEFRAFGDDEELARTTVTDSDWRLVHTDK